MATVNLIIKGKVQGVYYRKIAQEKARTLNITGWVKYISGGRVEVMATGTDEAIEAFIEWCKKGPDKAVVENVIVTPLSDTQFEDFSVILENYPADI
jgi:acylphosphatase